MSETITIKCSYQLDNSTYPRRMTLIYRDELILESKRYIFIPDSYTGLEYEIIGLIVENCVTIKTLDFKLFHAKSEMAEQVPMTDFPITFRYAFTTDPSYITLIQNEEFRINEQINRLTISRILYPSPEIESLFVLTAKIMKFNYGTYHTNEYVFPDNLDVVLNEKNYLILYEDLIDEYDAINSLRFQRRVEINSSKCQFFKQDESINGLINGESPMEEMEIVDIITTPNQFKHSSDIELEETQWLYQFKIKGTSYYVHLKYNLDDMIQCTINRNGKNVQLEVSGNYTINQYALFDSSGIEDDDTVNPEIIMKGTVRFTNPVLYLFFSTNFHDRLNVRSINVTGKAVYDSGINRTKSGTIDFKGCTVRSTYNVVHATYKDLMYERYLIIDNPVVLNELPTLLQFDTKEESSVLFKYNELRYIECLSSLTAYHNTIGFKIEVEGAYGSTIYDFNPTFEVPMYTKYTIETIIIPDDVPVGIDGFAHFRNMNLVDNTSLSGYKIQCTAESLRSLPVGIKEHDETFDIILKENTQLDENDYMCTLDENTSIGIKRFSGDLFYEKNLNVTSRKCRLWLDQGDTTILLVGVMRPISEEAAHSLTIPVDFKTSETTYQLETYLITIMYIPVEYEMIDLSDRLYGTLEPHFMMYALIDGSINLNKEKTFVIDFGQIDNAVDQALYYTTDRPDEVEVVIKTGDYFVIPRVSFEMKLHWFYQGKEHYETQIAPIEQERSGTIFANSTILSTLNHDETLDVDIVTSKDRKWYVRNIGEFIPCVLEYINSTLPETIKCTLPRNVELTNQKTLLGEETMNSTMNIIIPEFGKHRGTEYLVITQLLGTSVISNNIEKIEMTISVDGTIRHIPVNQIYHDESDWIYFETIEGVHVEMDENGVSSTPVIYSRGIEWYTSKGRETREMIDREDGYLRYGWYVMNEMYDTIYRRVNALNENEESNLVQVNERVNIREESVMIKGVKWYDEYQVERYDIKKCDTLELKGLSVDFKSKLTIPNGLVRITGEIDHNGELIVQSLEI